MPPTPKGPKWLKRLKWQKGPKSPKWKCQKMFYPKSSQIRNMNKIRHQIQNQRIILHLLRWVWTFTTIFSGEGQQMTIKHQKLVWGSGSAFKWFFIAKSSGCNGSNHIFVHYMMFLRHPYDTMYVCCVYCTVLYCTILGTGGGPRGGPRGGSSTTWIPEWGDSGGYQIQSHSLVTPVGSADFYSLSLYSGILQGSISSGRYMVILLDRSITSKI